MRFPLSPKHRIKKKSDFTRLQNGAGKIYSKHFLLVIGPSDTGNSRIGLTVTRKVDPRSVLRNRLKRRLRDVFRHVRPGLVTALDIIVIARQGASALTRGEIEREFTTALKAHKLWKEAPSPLT